MGGTAGATGPGFRVCGFGVGCGGTRVAGDGAGAAGAEARFGCGTSRTRAGAFGRGLGGGAGTAAWTTVRKVDGGAAIVTACPPPS